MILLEHYAGNFTTWLSPVQVKIKIFFTYSKKDGNNLLIKQLTTILPSNNTSGIKIEKSNQIINPFGGINFVIQAIKLLKPPFNSTT